MGWDFHSDHLAYYLQFRLTVKKRGISILNFTEPNIAHLTYGLTRRRVSYETMHEAAARYYLWRQRRAQ